MKKDQLAASVCAAVLCLLLAVPVQAQSGETPDISGIWQAMGSAHWDIENHSAQAGPIVELGAVGSIPGGLGVVDGGALPYQPWAAEQKKENRANWLRADPVVKCYMPGVPRATYMPFPFQIMQTDDYTVIAYEFASANRRIKMNDPDYEAPGEAWMGHSTGRWEGDTLVVNVTDQVPDTWFDSAGNFHSDELNVVERYTLQGPNTLMYEVTIDDPKVYTRPWTMSMPLYRRLEKNVQLLEFKCVEFVEELMYGHLLKDPK